MRTLKAWSLTCFALGLALALVTPLFKNAGHISVTQLTAVPQAIATGVFLMFLAALVFWQRHRLSALVEDDEQDSGQDSGPASGSPSSRYIVLFVASFVALFAEVMLIRYCGSQIRMFAFYRNVPLVSCFLGLGLGCCLGGGRSRHALSALLWCIPMLAFLAQGAMLIDGYLAIWDASSNTEHVLGAGTVAQASAAGVVIRQVSMGLFCAAMFVTISLLFVFFGRLLGGAFEGIPRIPAYTVNILGSLAGILGFVAVSYLQTPPWVWVLIALLPLLWWIRGRARGLALVGVLLCAAIVAPNYGETVWSPYQKLVGHHVPAEQTGLDSPSYLVEISDVFYQVALDLRPEAWARVGQSPLPHYDWPYQQIDTPKRVLIVGAGTGNDVAAALRAGAERVDAVDIDPAIIEMGRLHHPEKPYDDPRVRVFIDDARTAFRYLEPQSYDVVVFGLLDSHTQLGISSVRLDNYVFTLESFRSARQLLRPGGYLLVNAATFRDWFSVRLRDLISSTCAGATRVETLGTVYSYLCQVDEPEMDPVPRDAILPTDDWPFLYLQQPGVPMSYLVVLAMLALAAGLVLRFGGLQFGRLDAHHFHLFFLGAAFLLMEVYAINRLALLFGTTWLVSAITIALVLTLIVLGNFTVVLFGVRSQNLAYVALVASLILGYFLDPADFLGRGLGVALGYGLLLLLPIYFAALIFARSFAAAAGAGTAIGVNILGSVLGGWMEYASMAIGIRALVVLALLFYLASWLALQRSGRRRLSNS